jgi:transcriptional regulator with XRE-family HTH domain
MDTDIPNQSLGEYIRARRLARDLSLSDAAELSGLHFSYWSKLENGRYASPSPKHLKVIAKALEVSFEDLYGLAGYDVPERLPTFKPYLRAKYELPPQAVAELERYFELLRSHYGIPKDQPVFPPKPTQDDEPNADVTFREAA